MRSGGVGVKTGAKIPRRGGDTSSTAFKTHQIYMAAQELENLGSPKRGGGGGGRAGTTGPAPGELHLESDGHGRGRGGGTRHVGSSSSRTRTGHLREEAEAAVAALTAATAGAVDAEDGVEFGDAISGRRPPLPPGVRETNFNNGGIGGSEDMISGRKRKHSIDVDVSLENGGTGLGGRDGLSGSGSATPLGIRSASPNSLNVASTLASLLGVGSPSQESLAALPGRVDEAPAEAKEEEE